MPRSAELSGLYLALVVVPEKGPPAASVTAVVNRAKADDLANSKQSKEGVHNFWATRLMGENKSVGKENPVLWSISLLMFINSTTMYKELFFRRSTKAQWNDAWHMAIFARSSGQYNQNIP